MKKTVSVHIKGSNFLIEEDAYELLQDYIARLTKALKNEKGSKEIIEDVELRIAELCSEKLRDTRSVVELADIEDILNTLGDPSMYLGDEENEETVDGQEQTYEKANTGSSERRLFRDTENAVIAGVCQGIANFFNIDVVIVRAIFVVILLFAGFGFPLYLIMWIVVPKAKTTIDRLRMKGRPITVETLREEVEIAAERLKEKGSSFASSLRENDNYKGRFHRIGRIFTIIIGLGLIAWGLIWLIMFLIFIIGGFEFIPMMDENGFISLTDLGTLVLASPGDVNLAWTGVIMGGFSVILFLLLLGSTLLMKIRNKWNKISLIGLFSLGVIGGLICLYVGLKAGADLSIESKGENKELVVDGSVLTIIADVPLMKTPSGMKVKKDGGHDFMQIGEKNIKMYGVDLVYKESPDSLFHVYQMVSARGKSNKAAVRRADNIKHNIRLVNDTLYVATDFRFPKEDKIRDQRVELIIEIPAKSKVLVDGGTVRFGGPAEEDDEEVDSNARRRKYGTIYGDGYYEKREENW